MTIFVNVFGRNGYDLERIPAEIDAHDPSDVSRPDRFIMVATGGRVILFDGSDLVYDAQGYPAGGTITSITIGVGGPGIGITSLVNVLGLNLSAVALTDAIKQIKNFDNPFLFYGLFANTSQTITGGLGNDVLVPLSDGLVGASHSIRGGAGNDTIIDGRGADTLDGGEGNDIIQVGPAFVANAGGLFDGGGDRDTLQFSGGNFVTGLGPVVDLRRTDAQDTGSHGALTLHGIEDVSAELSFSSKITGNGVGNAIRGSSREDTLRGGSGNDVLEGADGADKVFGEAGRDTAQGGADDDLVSGGIANDLLSGQDGNDAILGETGFDRLFGGNGIDVLNGGAGGDSMAGGAGGDAFSYTAAAFGNDVISDWQDGLDKLRFKRSVADSFADFAITGNGTTSVTVALGSNSVNLRSSAGFTFDGSDVAFVA